MVGIVPTLSVLGLVGVTLLCIDASLFLDVFIGNRRVASTHAALQRGIYSKGKFVNHEFVVNGYEFVVNGYEFVVNGYEFVVNGYEFVPTELFL